MMVKSVMSMDMKIMPLSGLSTNLQELPNSVSGDSVTLSPWEAVITTASDIITVGPLAYPITIYKDFGEPVRISSVRLRRTVNGKEIFFNFLPTAINGNVFDMRVEFYEDQ